MQNTESFEFDSVALKKLSKRQLVEVILDQRDALTAQIEEKDKKISELIEQIDKFKQGLDEQKNKEINKNVNQPSSKKPEWDKDGNPKPKTDKKQDQKKNGKRQKRDGCGNVKKSDLKPDETNHIPLDACPDCGMDLSDREGRKKQGRLVEDIEPPQQKTIVSEEIEESKWCPGCKKMVSSKTLKALPGSDIGLNATIEMAYL